MFNAERIEVLKGPSALLNGAVPNGGVRGSINIIPKRASTSRSRGSRRSSRAQGTVRHAGRYRRRFGDRNEWGVRANGVNQNGQTAIDRERLELGFGSLGVDYRGERFRASVDFAYQDTVYDRNRGFFFVSPGVAIPPAPKLSRNLISVVNTRRTAQSWAQRARIRPDGQDNTLCRLRAGTIRENDLSSFKFLLSPAGTISTRSCGRPSTTRPIRQRLGFARASTPADPAQRLPRRHRLLDGADLSRGRAVPAKSHTCRDIYNPVPIAIPPFTDRDIGNARGTSQINRSVAFADTLRPSTIGCRSPWAPGPSSSAERASISRPAARPSAGDVAIRQHRRVAGRRAPRETNRPACPSTAITSRR